MRAAHALAMADIYGLGRRLGNARAGFWGALIFATVPFVVFSVTNFRLDLPLAAMMALALYTLVRSDDFTSERWSLGLGMVFGLGMLTKPPFAVYVLPPFLWSLWRAVPSTDRGRRFGERLPLSPWALLSPCRGTGPASSACPCRSSTAPSNRPRSSESGAADGHGASVLWALRKNRKARPILWLAR
jgi:Dolichyl-phosphate-mannose-protein mannosyltransferase